MNGKGLRAFNFKKFLSEIFRKSGMELPLIRQGYALPPSPRGEGYIKGSY